MPTDWWTRFGTSVAGAAGSVGRILSEGFNYLFDFFTTFWWHLLMSVGRLNFKVYVVTSIVLGGIAACQPHRYGDGDASFGARVRLGVSQQARSEGRVESNIMSRLDDDKILEVIKQIFLRADQDTLGPHRAHLVRQL